MVYIKTGLLGGFSYSSDSNNITVDLTNNGGSNKASSFCAKTACSFMAKKPEREVLNMEKVYVTKILSEESGTNTRGDKISVRILILYSNFTYEYVDLDGGWYKKPNDEKTDLLRGYECKDFIKYLDYQKCRYKKMTREETLSYLKEKEKEFQTFEERVHAIWTREESKKRWRSVFAPSAYDDGDKLENHYKKDES